MEKRSSRAASSSLTDDLLGHLTDDLVVEILFRLPAKSICLSKCVSRAWRSLISHPDHRGKLPQTLAGFTKAPDLRIADASASGRPLMAFSTSGCHPRCQLDGLLDCCNGILLWRCCWDGFHFHYVVCNPATKQWLALPDSGQASQMFAAYLGFDPAVSPHFHVFEFFLRDEGLEIVTMATGVQVYSSETGEWVRDEDGWNGSVRSAAVFHKGCLHLLTDGDGTAHLLDIMAPPRIIAVMDTEGRIKRNIPVPDVRLDYGSIHLSRGRLHFTSFERRAAGDHRLVHHVLDDYDSQDWVLKHTAEISQVFPKKNVTLGVDVARAGMHPDCGLIFIVVGWNKTLMCYDMERKKAQVIRDLGFDSQPPYRQYVPLYSELEALHT